MNSRPREVSNDCLACGTISNALTITRGLSTGSLLSDSVETTTWDAVATCKDACGLASAGVLNAVAREAPSEGRQHA